MIISLKIRFFGRQFSIPDRKARGPCQGYEHLILNPQLNPQIVINFKNFLIFKLNARIFEIGLYMIITQVQRDFVHEKNYSATGL